MAQEDVRDGLRRDAEVAPADRGSASAGRPSRGPPRSARRRRGRARRCCRRDRRRSRRGAGGRWSPAACYPVVARGRASRRTGWPRPPGTGLPSSPHAHGPTGRPRPARRPHRDDGRRPHGRGRARRPRRADRGGRHGRGGRRVDRPADPGRRAARPDRDARASGMPTSIRSRRASAGCGATWRALRGLDAYLAAVAAYAAAPPGRAVDPSATAGRWRTSRAGSPIAPISTGSCRTGRSTSRAATATRPGSTRRRSSRGRDRRRQPRPGRRPHRARRRRPADRRAPGGGDRRSSSGCCPQTTADELVAGLRLAQADLHALGITHWQDAIVEPGRGRGRLHDAGRSRRADRAGSSARCWWDRRRGAEQIDELVERRARTAIGRYAPTSVKLFAGRRHRELHRGRPRAVSRRRRPPDRGTAATSLIDPEALRRRRHAARCARVPGAFPRHRRAGRPRGARRRRGGPAGQRPRPTRARTSPTSRSSTRTTSPRFARARRRRQRAAVLGRATKRRWTSSRSRSSAPERATWQYPFGSLLAAGRDARDGLRLGRLDRRPAARDGGRGHARHRRATVASGRRSCPTSGSSSIDALAAFTDRDRLGQPPRGGGRLDRGRQGGGPGRPRSRPVRPRRRARSARPGSSPRSSTASPCTRRPRSRADAVGGGMDR